MLSLLLLLGSYWKVFWAYQIVFNQIEKAPWQKGNTMMEGILSGYGIYTREKAININNKKQKNCKCLLQSFLYKRKLHLGIRQKFSFFSPSWSFEIRSEEWIEDNWCCIQPLRCSGVLRTYILSSLSVFPHTRHTRLHESLSSSPALESILFAAEIIPFTRQ